MRYLNFAITFVFSDTDRCVNYVFSWLPWKVQDHVLWW